MSKDEALKLAWKWHQAPVKTSWGDEMVVADLAIDKDHTVSVYCERDQTAKVEAMLNPPAARRKPLTDAQLLYAYNSLPSWDWDLERLSPHLKKFARAIEAAHGIKELKT